MLSEAKHLFAQRARPFAELTLSLVLSEAKEQRRAQGDTALPILFVKSHYRPLVAVRCPDLMYLNSLSAHSRKSPQKMKGEATITASKG
jgi:hypothetical protein